MRASQRASGPLATTRHSLLPNRTFFLCYFLHIFWGFPLAFVGMFVFLFVCAVCLWLYIYLRVREWESMRITYYIMFIHAIKYINIHISHRNKIRHHVCLVWSRPSLQWQKIALHIVTSQLCSPSTELTTFDYHAFPFQAMFPCTQC